MATDFDFTGTTGSTFAVGGSRPAAFHGQYGAGFGAGTRPPKLITGLAPTLITGLACVTTCCAIGTATVPAKPEQVLGVEGGGRRKIEGVGGGP